MITEMQAGAHALSQKLSERVCRNIQGRTAIITGAGARNSIAFAVAEALAIRGLSRVALVDLNPAVNEMAEVLNGFIANGDGAALEAYAYRGDVKDPKFRQDVISQMTMYSGQTPQIFVPCAAITEDQRSIKWNKSAGLYECYPEDKFDKVHAINEKATIYWALELATRMANERVAARLPRLWTPEEGIKGTILFISSVSRWGNACQLGYAAAKAGLGGAAATLTREWIDHGIFCGVVNPGYCDTDMVRALGDDYIKANVLPRTSLGRLIDPSEIGDTVCFMINNCGVVNEATPDAGWIC